MMELYRTGGAAGAFHVVTGVAGLFLGKAAIEQRPKDWHQMTQSGAVELTPWPKVSTRDFLVLHQTVPLPS